MTSGMMITYVGMAFEKKVIVFILRERRTRSVCGCMCVIRFDSRKIRNFNLPTTNSEISNLLDVVCGWNLGKKEIVDREKLRKRRKHIKMIKNCKRCGNFWYFQF